MTLLMDEPARQEKVTGHDYMNLAEDFVAILGSKQHGLPRALKWADDQSETQTRPEDALAPAHEGAELCYYILVFVVGGRTMHVGEGGNGLEARRRLKVRYNLVTAITELGYTARLIQPAR